MRVEEGEILETYSGSEGDEDMAEVNAGAGGAAVQPGPAPWHALPLRPQTAFRNRESLRSSYLLLRCQVCGAITCTLS